MKTKFFLFIISFILSFNTYSQNNNFEVQKSIYEKAKSYNDPNVAISALYNMVALQPENVLLKDSLMREYLAISQWAPSYMISREILGLQPNNNFALEVSSVSLQNLGLKQEALNEYESLYLKTDRIDVLYTISFLQFELRNFNESLTNLDILISNNQTEEMTVSVSKDETTRQEIAIRAQLNYLKGLIYIEQENNLLAKQALNTAIEIAPEFQNAIIKLKTL
jgi:tetratricopeptide (TPR) repeat protein